MILFVATAVILIIAGLAFWYMAGELGTVRKAHSLTKRELQLVVREKQDLEEQVSQLQATLHKKIMEQDNLVWQAQAYRHALDDAGIKPPPVRRHESDDYTVVGDGREGTPIAVTFAPPKDEEEEDD